MNSKKKMKTGLMRFDTSILQFKQKIPGWIRDVERERDAATEAKSKRSSMSGR